MRPSAAQYSSALIEVVRISPMTFRSIDVGVVLDMMIHDIDIVQRLAESKVAKIDAIGVSVIARGRGHLQRPAQLREWMRRQPDRLAGAEDRCRMRLFSSDAYVSLDYQKRYGLVPPQRKRSGNPRGRPENPLR